MTVAHLALAPRPERTPAARQHLRLVPPPTAIGAVPADGLRAYLRSIDRFPLLTAGEETSLAKAIEVGLLAQQRLAGASPVQAHEYRLLAEQGRRAMERLVVCNLRLVVSVAKQVRGRGMDLIDLIAEGNLGLIRAVQKFDFTLGYKFSTYALWWIKQAIVRAAQGTSRLVRLPVQVAEQVDRLVRTRGRLELVQGRRPSAVELAQELGIGAPQLSRLARLASVPLSLDSKVPVEGELVPLGQALIDRTDPGVEETVAARTLPAAIDAALATLQPREADVIRLRFGLSGRPPMTLEEIGRRHGVSRERIRQIEKRGLQQLRDPSRSGLLREYLG